MKYAKRVVEIEAIEFTGGNYGSLDAFIGLNPGVTPLSGPYKIDGKDGVQRAYKGDLVVKRGEGDFIIMAGIKFKEIYQEAPEEDLIGEET